jgi:hypothetical protein
MFQSSAVLHQLAQYVLTGSDTHNGDRRSSSALLRFRRVRSQAWLADLWARLSGQPSSLLSLEKAQRGSKAGSRHETGIIPVPIAQIRGSEGRSEDFDRQFRPRKAHTRERWLSVATAREQGVALPAVDLVRIGEDYYVRDGHHRISVARAYGQESIDANFTVW